jgi:DNA adenine methylase
LKTPLSYYGGKQQLASRILELIPEHRIYCEPFLGGAAIFFAKPPSEEYAMRLQEVQIECCDAPRIIRSRDTAETFFYLDPPYVGSDQGHYDGYTQEDFNALLDLLETLKGKFLLSSYRNASLAEYTRRNRWQNYRNKNGLPLNKPLRRGEKQN